MTEAHRLQTLKQYKLARALRRNGSWWIHATEEEREIIRQHLAERSPAVAEVELADLGEPEQRYQGLGRNEEKRVRRRAAIIRAAERGEPRPSGRVMGGVKA